MAHTEQQLDILEDIIANIEVYADTLSRKSKFPLHEAAKIIQEHISNWVFERLIMPNVGHIDADAGETEKEEGA